MLGRFQAGLVKADRLFVKSIKNRRFCAPLAFLQWPPIPFSWLSPSIFFLPLSDHLPRFSDLMNGPSAISRRDVNSARAFLAPLCGVRCACKCYLFSGDPASPAWDSGFVSGSKIVKWGVLFFLGGVILKVIIVV